jgi:hypothetical protein
VAAEENDLRTDVLALAFASLRFEQGACDVGRSEAVTRAVFETTALRALQVVGLECIARQSVENAFLELLCRGKAVPFAMSLQFRRKQVAERIAALEQATSERKSRGRRSPGGAPDSLGHADELNLEPSKPPRDRDVAKTRELWKLHFELTALINALNHGVAATVIATAAAGGGVWMRGHPRSAALLQSQPVSRMSPAPPSRSGCGCGGSASGGGESPTDAPRPRPPPPADEKGRVCVSARCKRFDALRLRKTHHVQSVAVFTSPTKANV